MVLFWTNHDEAPESQGGGGKQMGFGKAKTRNRRTSARVTFTDVAGADEEKEELREIVEFLKNPKI